MGLLLSAVQISKSFSGKTLFNKLSFGIHENDKIGLVGPNGAGKSTLLKIITGAMTPDSGEVTKQKGLSLGYLEQSPVFNKTDTIIDYLIDNDEDIGPAYEWIAKLDLTQWPETTLISELSGGWQKRVALAKQLMKRPDILLLDEPTNHLDVTSILWLEDFLSEQKITYIMVTHDRLFLQRTTEKIWDLDPQNPQLLFIFDGNYLDYADAKEGILAAQRRHLQTRKNILTRETEWLRRGAQARQTKQKARIQSAHDLKSQVDDLKEKTRSRSVELNFSETKRQPQKLIQLENISYAIGEKNLWKDFSLFLSPQSRVALLGDNGTGKSTLLKIITGSLKPQSGKISSAPDLAISYFEQDKINLNLEKSVLRNICPDGDYVDYQGQFVFAKSYLEKFKFNYEQMDLPVKQLSGGEKSRLRLAQLMLKKAQVLILDEPTNDLDIQTLESLQESLAEFQGAVILVTHDRYFMDSIAKELIYINDRFTDQDRAIRFADYFQWEEWYQNCLALELAAEAKVLADKKNENKETQAANSQNGPKKKLSFKEKFEYENMESTILQLEQTLAKAQADIESPEVAAHAEKSNDLYLQINKWTQELDRLYARWTELEEKIK